MQSWRELDRLDGIKYENPPTHAEIVKQQSNLKTSNVRSVQLHSWSCGHGLASYATVHPVGYHSICISYCDECAKQRKNYRENLKLTMEGFQYDPEFFSYLFSTDKVGPRKRKKKTPPILVKASPKKKKIKTNVFNAPPKKKLRIK